MAHERGVQGYLWSERSRVSQGSEGYGKDDPCIKCEGDTDTGITALTNMERASSTKGVYSMTQLDERDLRLPPPQTDGNAPNHERTVRDLCRVHLEGPARGAAYLVAQG